MTATFDPNAIPPTREELAQRPGPVVIQFGASWCGHCKRFAPDFAALLKEFPQVQPIWVEDGPGQPLGRSFRVKLWPTLVFQRDGQLLGQVSRPGFEDARAGFQSITPPAESAEN